MCLSRLLQDLFEVDHVFKMDSHHHQPTSCVSMHSTQEEGNSCCIFLGTYYKWISNFKVCFTTKHPTLCNHFSRMVWEYACNLAILTKLNHPSRLVFEGFIYNPGEMMCEKEWMSEYVTKISFTTLTKTSSVITATNLKYALNHSSNFDGHHSHRTLYILGFTDVKRLGFLSMFVYK